MFEVFYVIIISYCVILILTHFYNKNDKYIYELRDIGEFD